MIRLGFWVWGENTTEVEQLPHFIIPIYFYIHITCFLFIGLLVLLFSR